MVKKKSIKLEKTLKEKRILEQDSKEEQFNQIAFYIKNKDSFTTIAIKHNPEILKIVALQETLFVVN